MIQLRTWLYLATVVEIQIAFDLKGDTLPSLKDKIIFRTYQNKKKLKKLPKEI